MTKQHPLYADALAKWKAKPDQTVYIGSTDTAKLIRARLKAKFPGTKFSVRTNKYAGGSSIRVSWTDGPTQALVDAFIDPFAGSGFDGMTDYKYSVGAWLMPDGSAEVRSVEAHYGTDGESFDPEQDGAVPVRFCADFVFTSRDYTAEPLWRVLQAYSAKYDDELAQAIDAGEVSVVEDNWGARFHVPSPPPVCGDPYGPDTALRSMAARRMMPDALPMATN